jgi:hypothetical protein
VRLRPGQVRLDPTPEDIIQDGIDLLWEDTDSPPPLASHIIGWLGDAGYVVVDGAVFLALCSIAAAGKKT